MLTLAGLYNVVCRVFNPGMLKYYDALKIVKTMTNMSNDDFCYIKTEVNNVQFYINRSARLRCFYLPFNMKGKECIFINIPLVGDNQSLDIVYNNIHKDAEFVFDKLIARFFPHETIIVRKLYTWMAAFKLSEELSMSINNFDNYIKKEVFIKVSNELTNFIDLKLIPSTIFVTKFGIPINNMDKFIDLVSTDTEELFNSYLFIDIFDKDYKNLCRYFIDD